MTHFVHVEAVMVTYSGAAAFEEDRQHCIQAAKNMCTEPHCHKSPLKTINALHVRVGVAVHQFSDCVLGGGVLGSVLLGMCHWLFRTTYPIIVYSVANYRPHLSHFWANFIVISRMEFNASRLLNIKTTAGIIFQLQNFYF